MPRERVYVGKPQVGTPAHMEIIVDYNRSARVRAGSCGACTSCLTVFAIRAGLQQRIPVWRQQPLLASTSSPSVCVIERALRRRMFWACPAIQPDVFISGRHFVDLTISVPAAKLHSPCLW